MLVRRFLSHLQYEKRYSAHTLKAYENDLGSFGDYLTQEYGEEAADLVADVLKKWLYEG